jgi:hypothetical protein
MADQLGCEAVFSKQQYKSDKCHSEWETPVPEQKIPVPDRSVKRSIPSSPSYASAETSDSEKAESPISQSASQIERPSPETEADQIPGSAIPTTVPMEVRHAFRRQDIERAQLSS